MCEFMQFLRTVPGLMVEVTALVLLAISLYRIIKAEIDKE
jgi:hypothetical protein